MSGTSGNLPVRPPAPVTSTVRGDPPPAAAAAAVTASPALLGPRLAEITWQGCRRGAPVNGEVTRTHAAAAVAMVLRRVGSKQLVSLRVLSPYRFRAAGWRRMMAVEACWAACVSGPYPLRIGPALSRSWECSSLLEMAQKLVLQGSVFSVDYYSGPISSMKHIRS
jgi:hypothetical protein